MKRGRERWKKGEKERRRCFGERSPIFNESVERTISAYSGRICPLLKGSSCRRVLQDYRGRGESDPVIPWLYIREKVGRGGGGGGWEKDSNNCWSKNIDSKLSRPFNCTPKHKAYWFSSRVFSFRALLPIQTSLSLLLSFSFIRSSLFRSFTVFHSSSLGLNLFYAKR